MGPEGRDAVLHASGHRRNSRFPRHRRGRAQRHPLTVTELGKSGAGAAPARSRRCRALRGGGRPSGQRWQRCLARGSGTRLPGHPASAGRSPRLDETWSRCRLTRAPDFDELRGDLTSRGTRPRVRRPRQGVAISRCHNGGDFGWASASLGVTHDAEGVREGNRGVRGPTLPVRGGVGLPGAPKVGRPSAPHRGRPSPPPYRAS